MTDPLERRINRAVYEQDVATARRAGAEEMRERAAKIVAASAHNWDINRSAPERLAAEIRALPVE